MRAPSLPGSPELCLAITPVNLPPMPELKSVMGIFVSLSPFIADNEDVKDVFFAPHTPPPPIHLMP